MKKLLPTASFLLLSALAVKPQHSSPVQATPPVAPSQGLEGRVAALESQLAAEKKRHDETRALLEQTLVYLEKQSKAAEALLAVLDESEQQGFAVGENWQSRKTLLGGFRAYWGEAQTGVPRPPAAQAAKPVAPTRDAAPARQ